MILIDTGPLFALFDPRDAHHEVCHQILAGLTQTLATTEAVLTEALHLTRSGSPAEIGLQALAASNHMTMLQTTEGDLSRCFEYMHRYADLPMDFADSTLIVQAERRRICEVFTLDLKDFETYRIKRGHRYYPVEIVGVELLRDN